MLDEKLTDMLESQKDVDKLRALKTENKELLKLLRLEEKNSRQLLNKLQELKGNIRVLCRVRPLLAQEKSSKYKPTDFKMIGSNKLQTDGLLAGQAKTFKFDRVFKASCKQGQVFDEVQGLVQSAMEGYNVCILAYGQTGSGKTYTMVGDDKNPGLYFTSVDELYRYMKLNKGRYEYDISVSVVEIYNEQMRDLLSKDQKYNQFKLMEGPDGNLYGD